MKLNRRSFMQALGVIGIGGGLPAGKTAKPVLPAAERDRTAPYIKGGPRTNYGVLCCNAAGIRGRLCEWTWSRQPFCVKECNGWREYEPGPTTIDCSIEREVFTYKRISRCVGERLKWVLLQRSGTRQTFLGILISFSVIDDGEMSTARLTIVDCRDMQEA